MLSSLDFNQTRWQSLWKTMVHHYSYWAATVLVLEYKNKKIVIKRLQHRSVRVGLEMSLTLLRLCTSKTWNPRQPAQGRQPPMPPSGINKAVRAGSGFIYVTLVPSYLNIKYITKSEHHRQKLPELSKLWLKHDVKCPYNILHHYKSIQVKELSKTTPTFSFQIPLLWASRISGSAW